MDPMTELDIAQGIQSQIAELDLSHPHAREACMGLLSHLERSLGHIKGVEDEECFQESMRAMDRSILRIQELKREIGSAPLSPEDGLRLIAGAPFEINDHATDAAMDAVPQVYPATAHALGCGMNNGRPVIACVCGLPNQSLGSEAQYVCECGEESERPFTFHDEAVHICPECQRASGWFEA